VISVDLTIVPALAALAGSLIGACASVATTFVGQRLQARAARLVSELREGEQPTPNLSKKLINERRRALPERSRKDHRAGPSPAFTFIGG
jgi:hypothetical protein